VLGNRNTISLARIGKKKGKGCGEDKKNERHKRKRSQKMCVRNKKKFTELKERLRVKCVNFFVLDEI
jgi:hypothetical protein